MLCRFRLDLAGVFQFWQQRQVHKQCILSAKFHTHLTNCFQKRQGFYVPDRPANFNKYNLVITGAFINANFDFIDDVRNDLNCLSHIVALPFPTNHPFIHPSGREVIGLSHWDIHKPLVMSKIKVGFRTIVGYKNLTVLERAHRSRVDVDVRVQFKECDRHLARFK